MFNTKIMNSMRYILLILGLLAIQSCRNSNVKNVADVVMSEQSKQVIQQEIPMDSISGPYLRLDKNRHNFGKIYRDNTLHIPIEFGIENIGKYPLVINKADVSCGCLSVDYPKAPIRPGEKAKLIVNVNTKSQEGMFNKTVFLKSNADNDVELIRIVGEVKK